MIDLTPLDVRKKRGDFKKMLRGYDPQEVDTFLELVAERLEALVKESMSLKERTDMLAEQVKAQEGREKAIQEALVTAQTLREDIAQQASREAESVREQAKREAEMVTRQAEAEAKQMRDQVDAEVAQLRQQAVGDTELLRRQTEGELERLTHELEGLIESKTGIIDELERKRTRFLRAFRSLLERELDAVAIEEGKVASEDAILELDLTGGQRRVQARMIETAALDMLQDESMKDESMEQEAADAAHAEPLPQSEPVAGAPVLDFDPSTGEGGDSARVETVAVETNALEEAVVTVSVVEETPQLEATPHSMEIPGEAELDQAVDAVLIDDTPAASPAPVEVSSEAAAERVVERQSPEVEQGEHLAEVVTAEVVEVEVPPEPSPEETLVDRAFAILDEAPAAPDSEVAPETGDADLRVDGFLSDESASSEAEEVISINTLAPEPAEPFEDEARAAVNELFDREDVPTAEAEAVSEDVEDAWSKVLRGEDGTSEDQESEGKGAWSPNFPDKGRKSEGSGWSRSKDPSRWR